MKELIETDFKKYLEYERLCKKFRQRGDGSMVEHLEDLMDKTYIKLRRFERDFLESRG